MCLGATLYTENSWTSGRTIREEKYIIIITYNGLGYKPKLSRSIFTFRVHVKQKMSN